MDNLFGLSSIYPSFKLFPVVIVFIVSTGALLTGKFSVLDSLIKLIGIILFISTLIVFILTLINGPSEHESSFTPLDIFDDVGILFIIALMGWMPTALDMSCWTSLWVVEKIKSK